MDIIDSIKQALKANHNLDFVEILNESANHLGHAGYGDYSHLCIKLPAKSFANMSRVERYRVLHKEVVQAAGQEIHSIRFEFV